MENQETDLLLMRLTIASTFTCNPIKEVFEFWSEHFGFKADVRFSPYDQVFPELLKQHSLLNRSDSDARIVIVKIDDWIRNLPNLEASSILSHIVANIHTLCEFAAISSSYVNSPLFLTISPNSSDSLIHPDQQAAYEHLIKDKLSEYSNIFVTTASEIDMKYPVDKYYDSQRNQLGHIPYRREYFTAMGSTIFRKLLAEKRKPYKVIVLDCDNTLWGGVCGEAGSNGIILSEPYKKLQRFMQHQMKSGKILCLCSKNVEEDVNRVFTERSDMILSADDIVNSKINWLPKSQNIKMLSEELNLGLDSFIFIDDNPVECAEVRANCPEVLTLNLPADPDEITTFLDHAWPFDILKTTDEDQLRTKLYKDNIRRTGYKSESSSLIEFIKGLNLDIEINNAGAEEISRISQLSFRTNQFNFTTIRRTETEIKELLKNRKITCKVCRVKDRFGDYGLVGMIIYQTLSDRLEIDSFMLSCRVLGRGVEHEMLKSIGKDAIAKGLDSVQINFQGSEKNQPALDFLESVFEDFSVYISTGKNGYMTSSATLRALSYDPYKSISKDNTNGGAEYAIQESAENQNDILFEQIAGYMNNAVNITQMLRSNGHIVSVKSPKLTSVAGRDTFQILTEIWEEILEKKDIGPQQHFFDVGGTSLKAVEVLSQMNERFNKNLTIVSLFEHSTIQLLVNLIDDLPVENTQFNKIMKRATSRRDRIKRID